MLALAPGTSWALGLGKPSTRAVLGETLRLTVPVRLLCTLLNVWWMLWVLPMRVNT